MSPMAEPVSISVREVVGGTLSIATEGSRRIRESTKPALRDVLLCSLSPVLQRSFRRFWMVVQHVPESSQPILTLLGQSLLIP
jgi:hypothetical protein